MTTFNLINLADRLRSKESSRQMISIARWKTRKANAHLLERFSTHLGLDFSTINSTSAFEVLCNYGAITR